MYYPRFTKVIIHYFFTQEKTLFWRNKIGMHTSRDDYLINTLRFVFEKEETQIYNAILPESMTSPEMGENKAYKTYLGYATGIKPPEKARKFKKLASPKLTTILVSPKEPTRKSKRVKRPAKKSTNAPIAGIEFLSEVALTEEAQYEEVRKKSLRDFHKNHPSDSCIVTKIVLNAAKIKPSVTNQGTGAKPRVPDVTKEESTKSEAESWRRDEDDGNNDHDSSSEGSDQESDSGNDNTQSDNEKGSDSEHETNENETSSEFDQEENKEEIEDDEEEKGDEFVKTPSNYTPTDDEDETNVELKTEVPVTSSSCLSDLASKFLNFGDIPSTNTEIVSPIDVHVHHEVPSNETPTLLTSHVSVIIESSPVHITVFLQSLPSFTPPPPQSTPTPTTKATNPLSAFLNFAPVFQLNNKVSALEKEVSKLKKDDLLNTQVTALILPNEMSNFSPPVIKSMVTKSLKHVVLAKDFSQPRECYNGLLNSYELDKSLFSTYDKVYSLKRRRQDKDKDEDPSARSDRRLKKKKTSKDAEPTKGLKAKESKSGSSKGTKSQSKSSKNYVQAEEPEFEVADSDMPQNQEGNLVTQDEELHLLFDSAIAKSETSLPERL
nr:hypothetical protein [Tanacetum cinerariifolium]